MARIKTVFGSDEIAHIFASRQYKSGRVSCGNMSFDSDTFYSYAAPIAHIWQGVALLNPDSYSMTTHKHQRRIRDALRHFECVSLPVFEKALTAIRYPSDSNALTYLQMLSRRITDQRELLQRKRTEWTRAAVQFQIDRIDTAGAFIWNRVYKKRGKWENAVAPMVRAQKKADEEQALRHIADFCAQFTLPREYDSESIDRALQELGSDKSCIERVSTLWARHEKQAARFMGAEWATNTRAAIDRLRGALPDIESAIERGLAERAARVEAEKAELIEKWLNGAQCDVYGLPRVLCRVMPDGVTLETSQGARVPLDGAKAIARLAKQCRDNGATLEKPDLWLGIYKGLRIDSAGGIHIQCHSIPWQSIAQAVERFAPDTFEGV